MQTSIIKMEEKQNKTKLRETTTRMPHSFVRTVHQNIEKNSHNRNEQLEDYGIMHIHIQNFSSGKMMYNSEKNPKMSINPIKISHSRKRNDSPFIRTIYQQCSNQNINEFKSANINVGRTSNIVQKTKYYGANNPISFVVKSDKTSGLFENESDLKPVDFSSPKLTRRTLHLHTDNSKEKQPSSWSKSKRSLDGYFKEIQKPLHVASNNVDLHTDCYSEYANSAREGINGLDKGDFRKTEISKEHGMQMVSTNSTITTRINVRDVSSSRREHHEIHDEDYDGERGWNDERFASNTLEQLSTETCKDSSKGIGKHVNGQDTRRKELKDDRTESQNIQATNETMDDPLNKRFGSASAILARVKRLELKYNFRTSTDFDNGDSNKDLKIDIKDGIKDREFQKGISSNDQKLESNNHNSNKSANFDGKNEQQKRVTGSYEDLRHQNNIIIKSPHCSSDEDLRYHKKSSFGNSDVPTWKENQNRAFLNSNPSACSNEHKRKEKIDKDPDVKLIHENKSNSYKEITLDSEKTLDNPRFCSQQETIQCSHETESVEPENHGEGAVRNVEQSMHNHNHDVEKAIHNHNHDVEEAMHNHNHDLEKAIHNHNHDLEKAMHNHNHNVEKAMHNLNHDYDVEKPIHNHNHDLEKAINNHNHDLEKAMHNHNHNVEKAMHNHNHDVKKSMHNHNHDAEKAMHNHNHDVDNTMHNHNHDVENTMHNHNHDVEKTMHNLSHDYDVCENDGRTEDKIKMEDNLTDMEDKGIDMTHSKDVSTLKEKFEHLQSKGHNHSKRHILSLVTSSSSSEDSDSKETKKGDTKMFKFGKLKSMFENPDGRFMQLSNESEYDNEKGFSFGKSKENRCNVDDDVEDGRTEEKRRNAENTEDATLLNENSPANLVASTPKNTNSFMDLQFKITQVKICSSPKTLRRKFDVDSQPQETTNEEASKECQELETEKIRDENGNEDELVIQVSSSSAGLKKPEKDNIKSSNEEISSEEIESMTTKENLIGHDADINVAKANIGKQNIDNVQDCHEIIEKSLDSWRNSDEKNDSVSLVDDSSVKDDETKHFHVTELDKPAEKFTENTEELRKDDLLEDVYEKQCNMIGNYSDSPNIQICISSFDSIEDSIHECIDTLNSRTSRYNNVPDVSLPELLKSVANEDLNDGAMTYKNGMHYGPYMSYSRKANDMKDHAAELGLYTNCFKEKNRVCEELLTSKTMMEHHTEESQLSVGKIVSKKNTELSSIPLYTENHPLNIAKITPYNTHHDLKLFAQPVSRFTESLFKDDCFDVDIDTLKKPNEAEDLMEHSSEEQIKDELESQTQTTSQIEFQELNVSLRLPISNQKQQLIPLGIVNVNKMENLENMALDMFMKHLKTIDDAECLQIERNDIKFVDITKDASNAEKSIEQSSNVDEKSNNLKNKCFVELKGGDESCMAQLAYQTLIPKKTLEKYLATLIDCHSLIFFGTSGIGKTYIARNIAAALDRRLKDEHNIDSAEIFFYSNVDLNIWNEIVRTVELREKQNSQTILVIDGFKPDLFGIQNFDSFLSEKQASAYIIATCATSIQTDTNSLLTNHNSRNVCLSTNEDPVKGLLKRYLRRKFITSSGSLDDKQFAVIEWLDELWQNINKIIESFSSSQETIVPSVFFSCPENSNEIEEWFIDLWNYSLAPYIEHSSKDGCQYANDSSMLPDTCDWIMQTYLWKEEKNNLWHKLRRLNIKKFGLKESLHEKAHKNLTTDNVSLVKYILRLQRCIEESKNSTFKKRKEQRKLYLESTL